MVFSSLVFLFIFLPAVLIGYYSLRFKYRNLFLTVASLFFYAWGEQELVMLMLFSIAVNYLGGLKIGESSGTRCTKTKIWLFFFIGINVLLLGYFKYTNFFIESVNELGLFRLSSLNEIVLPIGISFFTFQGMSYLIDIYFGKVKPQRNLTNLALYISMFPQLIAGPIVRYIDVSKQIESSRYFSITHFQEGIRRFIIGLFKKVIIANPIGLVADAAFNADSGSLGWIALWLGAIFYAFQIYFDFSGYSDMAIGLGKMFGFDFLENFNLPYISRSIKEFWRRWHISLSTWFRDYLYIPLGGNRKGVFRTYANLIIVFFITGMWHGASWNFIIWGLFHGFFLVLERLGLDKFLERLPRIIGYFYTWTVVLAGWVFFRAETLHEATAYLEGMFSFRAGNNAILYQYFTPYFIFVLFLAIVLSSNIRHYIEKWKMSLNYPDKITPLFYPFYLFLLFCCLLELAESNYNPFIYFRF